MRLLLIVLLGISTTAQAYEHRQASPASLWSKDSLERYQSVNDAYVPITISHKGEATEYFIEVNSKPVSEVFTLDDESISIDVPVNLEPKEGNQSFRICSVSLSQGVGTRVCNKTELIALY